MQIGEKAPAGVYDVTCLVKGAHGRVRFTDRGETSVASGASPNRELAKRRTALSAAFGAYLKRRHIPIAFEEQETEVSVLCRKCEGKIPMEILISAEDQAPVVTFDGELAVPDDTVMVASNIAKDARNYLNALLMKHGYHIRSMTLRFGFAGEIVISSMLNLDTVEVMFSEGALSRPMTNEMRLVSILNGKAQARVAA